MRFINDDVKIEVGARTTVKISVDQLANRMFHEAKLITDDYPMFTKLSTPDLVNECENAVYCVVKTLMRLNPIILADNKYNVRPYHCATEITDFGADVGESIAGFHTIDGLTFFGFFAGDAWDYATFMVIYHDGKNLRLYTPVRGNFINTDYETALGGEFDKADAETIKKFGMLGAEEYSLADIYVQKYGFERMELEEVGFNFDAIRDDILATIKTI